MSFTASLPAGNCEPSSAEVMACRLKPLRRSTTGGGKSSSRSPAAHRASGRLIDTPPLAVLSALSSRGPKAEGSAVAFSATRGAIAAMPATTPELRRKLRRFSRRFVFLPGMLVHLPVEGNISNSTARRGVRAAPAPLGQVQSTTLSIGRARARSDLSAPSDTRSQVPFEFHLLTY